jgi:hypothetical protein
MNLLLSLLMLYVGVSIQTAASTRVSIFVGPQTRDGFIDVDSGILDSIKDIQDEFRRSRQFVIAQTAEEATILLLVVGRRISGSAGAVGVTTPGTTVGGGSIAGDPQPAITVPGVTMVAPINRRVIDTVLRVGTYGKAIASEDEQNDHWRTAAKQVVKDVTAWTAANQAALPRRQP